MLVVSCPGLLEVGGLYHHAIGGIPALTAAVDADEVDVVRILHQRMDVDQQPLQAIRHPCFLEHLAHKETDRGHLVQAGDVEARVLGERKRLEVRGVPRRDQPLRGTGLVPGEVERKTFKPRLHGATLSAGHGRWQHVAQIGSEERRAGRLATPAAPPGRRMPTVDAYQRNVTRSRSAVSRTAPSCSATLGAVPPRA